MIGQLKSLGEMFRYSSVGLLHNILGLSFYIILTYIGLKPEYAVTILYPLGVIFSYYGNAAFTFKYNGNSSSAKLKFFLAHLLGYLINITLLYIFVQQLMYRHELIQFFSIFIIAIYLFLASKFFVFKNITKEHGK